ncbi:endonuclease-reverse transcriptase [Elysia marginata]|uniref:Endonuclease-reverse transcriptase n=1 Tax=Elysia marginata TaxID=1093978 RepID=A0AAV4F7A2_9GAST|nr:endonuclease-reverse transcriptase [Elysia marginata]
MYCAKTRMLSLESVAAQWRPKGHRKHGRPNITKSWRRTVEAEAATMGQSWGTLRMLAQDRVRWREFIAALVAIGKKGKTIVNSATSTKHKFTTADYSQHTIKKAQETGDIERWICVRTGTPLFRV